MTLQLSWPKVVVTLLAMASIPAALYYTSEAIANRPMPEPEPSQVLATKVKVKQIQALSKQPSIVVHGEVVTAEQVSLQSQVSGAVTWRHPKLVTGGLIAAGESLVRIDKTEQEIALAAAEEALASAHMNLQQERRQAKQALLDWQRAGIDQAAPASLLREAQISLAKASLKTAQARLKQAQKQLQLTDIKAPFASLVSQGHVSVGSLLSPASPIAELQATAVAHIEVLVSDAQWQHIKGNWQTMDVKVEIPSHVGVSWSAKVAKVAHSIDSNTRMRKLTVAVAKPLQQKEALLFGSFAKVTLQGTEQTDLLPIPAGSVTADGYIWHVHEEQLAKTVLQSRFSIADTYYMPKGELPQPLQLVTKPLASYLVGTQVLTSSAGGKHE